MTTRLKLIIITGMALIISGLCFAAWNHLENRLEKQFTALTQALPRLDIDYQKMQARPLGRRIILQQPVILYNNDIEIQARQMVFQDLGFSGGMPVKMTIMVHDMEADRFFPELKHPGSIEKSGTSLSPIDGTLRYEYHPGESRLDIPLFILEGAELGFFCAGIFLSNLNVEYILSLQNPFLLGAALLGIRIDYLQAGYQDYGLVRRLNKVMTETDDPEEVAPGYSGKQDFGALLGSLAENEDSTPVHNFLNDQAPLNIKLTPMHPVPFSAILTSPDIDAVSRLLNLEISNQSTDFCHRLSADYSTQQ